MIFRVRDNLDIYLVEDKIDGLFLYVYYPSTKKQKRFKVNQLTVDLIELFDAILTLSAIKDRLLLKHNDITENSLLDICLALEKALIIQKVEAFTLISKDELDRYSRALTFLREFIVSDKEIEQAFIKLKQTKFVIFGCGAIGGNIAIELAMAGAEHFILYDKAKVSHSDLARHMFFKEKHVCSFKTEALKSELLLINSKIKVETVSQIFTPDTILDSLFKDNDFFINSLDEPYIGYSATYLSRLTIKYLKPLFVAGGFDAHLASSGELIIPRVTPCVDCYTSHFKAVLKDWKPVALDTVANKLPSLKLEVGGLASLSLFSASIAALKILKYLLNIDANVISGRGELNFDSLAYQYSNISRNPDCDYCKDVGGNQ